MSLDVKYHCTSCLDGMHACSLYVPLEWPGVTSSSRCVCRRCGVTKLATAPVRSEASPRPRHPGRPSRWTPDKIEELVELTGQGLSSREVAERVGARADTVRHYLMVARRRAA